jgi:hypothetical protein
VAFSGLERLRTFIALFLLVSSFAVAGAAKRRTRALADVPETAPEVDAVEAAVEAPQRPIQQPIPSVSTLVSTAAAPHCLHCASVLPKKCSRASRGLARGLLNGYRRLWRPRGAQPRQ